MMGGLLSNELEADRRPLWPIPPQPQLQLDAWFQALQPMISIYLKVVSSRLRAALIAPLGLLILLLCK